MQLQSDKSSKFEEVKTQFRAREGYYRLMNSPDYSQRSQRAMGSGTGTTNSNSSNVANEKTCIKISLVTIDNGDGSIAGFDQQTPGFSQSFQSHKNQNSIDRASDQRGRNFCDKKICFNVGRELFVYNYDGVRTGPDASNPIYKRSYKGSSPTCHDFNQTTATTQSLSLLVGFSHGQVQLIDLNGKDDQESCREFNIDRLIDKTRVTCVRWIPNSPSLFLAAHASGHMYLYKDDLTCGTTMPIYQLYKQSDGVSIFTCKTKTSRNPIYKWVIGSHSSDNLMSNPSSASTIIPESESFSINEFAFSPCAKYLACVSQDGFLRVYCYDTMELIGRARSYYGGLSCVCWSPDGKYVVTGGEDDLITVWSFFDRRVVARGMGHKSWVSVVAFDSYYSGYDLKNNDIDDDAEDDEDFEDKDLSNIHSDFETDDNECMRSPENNTRISGIKTNSKILDNSNELRGNHTSQHCNNYINQSEQAQNGSSMSSYRFGSVGQDTQLCLWDLNDDLLRQPIAKGKLNYSGTMNSKTTIGLSQVSNTSCDRQTPQDIVPVESSKDTHQGLSSNGNSSNIDSNKKATDREQSSSLSRSPTVGFLSSKASGFTKTFSLVSKRDKRHPGLKNTDKSASRGIVSKESQPYPEDPTKLLGSGICPRMNEVPILEPTICKKISFERLTSLVFCKGGFITSCQDGFVFSWARPSKKPQRLSPSHSNDELRVIDVGTSSIV